MSPGAAAAVVVAAAAAVAADNEEVMTRRTLVSEAMAMLRLPSRSYSEGGSACADHTISISVYWTLGGNIGYTVNALLNEEKVEAKFSLEQSYYKGLGCPLDRSRMPTLW